jgi:hypothetical protein
MDKGNLEHLVRVIKRMDINDKNINGYIQTYDERVAYDMLGEEGFNMLREAYYDYKMKYGGAIIGRRRSRKSRSERRSPRKTSPKSQEQTRSRKSRSERRSPRETSPESKKMGQPKIKPSPQPTSKQPATQQHSSMGKSESIVKSITDRGIETGMNIMLKNLSSIKDCINNIDYEKINNMNYNEIDNIKKKIKIILRKLNERKNEIDQDFYDEEQ